MTENKLDAKKGPDGPELSKLAIRILVYVDEHPDAGTIRSLIKGTKFKGKRSVFMAAIAELEDRGFITIKIYDEIPEIRPDEVEKCINDLIRDGLIYMDTHGRLFLS